MALHRLTIAREQYKFSCAHMTVFPDGTKERLHGHNYTVAIALEVARIDLAAMVPFAKIKALLAEHCAAWKERVLLPARSPFLAVLRDDEVGLEVVLCGKRYVMPREDALLLPIDNVSVEALAALVAARLRDAVAALSPHLVALEVSLEESPGQGASCRLALGA